jgi:hypothetical protein
MSTTPNITINMPFIINGNSGSGSVSPALLDQASQALEPQIDKAVQHALKELKAGKSVSQVTQDLEKELAQIEQQAASSSGQSAAGAGSASSENWLQAIAEAMGKALGNIANKMQQDAKGVNSPDAQTSSASTAALQADSQTFSMLAQALQTVISTAGQGLKTLAQG